MKTWRGLHSGVGVFENAARAREYAKALRLESKCEPDEVSVLTVAANEFTTAM